MGFDADHRHVRWRSREMRRRHLFARRHGDSVRRYSARQVTVSMTINSPAPIILRCTWRWPRSRASTWSQALRHSAERHSEGIHRAEGIHLSAAAVHAAGHRHHRIRRTAHAPLQSDFDQRLSHSRSRLDGGAGTRFHACATASSMSIGRSSADWRSTTSRRASASSSTPITISSRRSRSTARRASSGRDVMRDRFGAKDERSWKLRFHAQTAGCSLTWQQPQ